MLILQGSIFNGAGLRDGQLIVENCELFTVNFSLTEHFVAMLNRIRLIDPLTRCRL